MKLEQFISIDQEMITMVTDFDIYHYISTHLNGEYPKDNFQKIIDQRIEFAKKHKPILFKECDSYGIYTQNREKSVILKGSNGSSIHYQFDRNNGKLTGIHLNFDKDRIYDVRESHIRLFEITESGWYSLLDSSFILLEESKIPSETLLGNIKTLLPMFYPAKYQEAFYSFDLVENRSNYCFRIKLNQESHHNWSGRPIGYLNIGYELGKYFHLLISDIREIEGIPRENIEVRVEHMRGEI